MGWCEHIQEKVSNYEDNLEIFTTKPRGTIAIPYVPTYDIWIPVDWQVIQKDEMYSVTIRQDALHGEDNAEASESIKKMDKLLTISSPDEGIQTLRLAVASWFKPHKVKTSCLSKAHSFMAEVKLARAQKAENKPMLEANDWCLTWFGKCIECYTNSKKSSFDDLVPDDEGKRSPWSVR